MIKEYEGKTEKEAIDAAVEELGLERDEFDVEILETQKSGFLNLQKKVVIRVHTHDSVNLDPIPETNTAEAPPRGNRKPRNERPNRDKQPPRETQAASVEERPARREPLVPVNGDPENDFEHAIVDFVQGATEHMGYPAKAVITFREEGKIGINLESEHSGILIGRRGKNIDALQLLVNVVASRLHEDLRVVLDSEDYRNRREESLIRLAQKVGDQVKRSKSSQLLDPMNPFERRLIHTTLNSIEGIDTKSEGEGLYKQVRVYYRGN